VNKLIESSIIELQELMDKGQLTAKELVEIYLERIEKIDVNGPKLNAVIELNPDAYIIADELDKERLQKGKRSILHGIPIMVKDNINTADKMMTTAGSLALVGHLATEDAFVVKKLREAGAIILGKTNLSEWANFRGNKSISGWSSRGGLTRNPYALDRSACGSSSGSAVAVAANLCAVSVGTETDGSIICPAQINGIIGIKPTIGLISRSGIIPIAHSQDTAGPMGRTVSDAAILLGAMVGEDPEDAVTNGNGKKKFSDYTQFLDKDGLKSSRIGVVRNFFGFNKHVDTLMESAIEKMKEYGAIIVDPANIEHSEDYENEEYNILLYEIKHDMKEYLAKYGERLPFKTLKDLIEHNEDFKDEIMPYFGQEHFEKAEEKGPLTDQEYLADLEKAKRLSGREGIDATLEKHELDALIAPSGGPTWIIDLLHGDRSSGGTSSPAAVSGYPSITVPLGYIFGLPVGISFISGAYQEPTLLKLAFSFEQATRIRKPPQFIKTVHFER
jgi:amidase